MKTKKSWQGFCALLWALMLVMIPLQVAAGDGVPAAVLEAKNGVVRIITAGEQDVFSGSGFLVGKEDNVYVVTNHHVVEDAETFYVFYDTGKYVAASIYYDDVARDLCVLKLEKSIPRAQVLPLETGEIESGMAVYALGFPGAADYFTQDYGQDFDTAREFMASITADKQSMTVTDGIISAIHSSRLIGDGSQNVDTLQTNTAINSGNSGGPLLNSAGRVVGVNTMGITVADSMNGAVHADELVQVLKDGKVHFEETPEGGTAEAAASVKGNTQEKEGGTTPLLIIIGLMAAVLVCGGIAVAVIFHRQKRMPVKGGITLAAFEKSYRRIEETAVLEMTLRFIDELLPRAWHELGPLLTPDNVVIGDTSLALREKHTNAHAGAWPAFEGYSAPETHDGRASPASTVYFVGAIMYTLLTGHRPPEVRGRLASNQQVFTSPNAIQALVNHAMEPYAQNRIQDLYQLSAAMQQLSASFRAQGNY